MLGQVTFNSLIAACAQGAQWEKAAELFETMQTRGCRPDPVTYGGLIAAYEKVRPHAGLLFCTSSPCHCPNAVQAFALERECASQKEGMLRCSSLPWPEAFGECVPPYKEGMRLSTLA